MSLPTFGKVPACGEESLRSLQTCVFSHFRIVYPYFSPYFQNHIDTQCYIKRYTTMKRKNRTIVEGSRPWKVRNLFSSWVGIYPHGAQGRQLWQVAPRCHAAPRFLEPRNSPSRYAISTLASPCVAHVFCRFWVEVWNAHNSLKGSYRARLKFSRAMINIYDQIELFLENGFSLGFRLMNLPPPKNGEIAMWPNMRVVKCKYCVSQKRYEANDKAQWYNVLLTFVS